MYWFVGSLIAGATTFALMLIASLTLEPYIDFERGWEDPLTIMLGVFFLVLTYGIVFASAMCSRDQ